MAERRKKPAPGLAGGPVGAGKKKNNAVAAGAGKKKNNAVAAGAEIPVRGLTGVPADALPDAIPNTIPNTIPDAIPDALPDALTGVLTDAEKRERMAEIVSRLRARYPDAECALEYGGEGWRLLIMGRLSAQCTDARVNIVCRELFSRFPTLDDVADAPIEDLERIIRPCGLYRTKAASVKEACGILRGRYGGQVPTDMESLLSLPGVGRKIANLLLGDIYGIPGIVADTHCIRLCGRFGMCPESLTDPAKVERILSAIVEPSEQTALCHRLVDFGRDVCTARAPKCGECPLGDVCEHRRRGG